MDNFENCRNDLSPLPSKLLTIAIHIVSFLSKLLKHPSWKPTGEMKGYNVKTLEVTSTQPRHSKRVVIYSIEHSADHMKS